MGKIDLGPMTQEEGAKFLRQAAESTARFSQNWENFELLSLEIIKAAMDAARQCGRDEALKIVPAGSGPQPEG